LQAAEEALCGRIVPTVALTAHAGPHAIVLKTFLVLRAGIMYFIPEKPKGVHWATFYGIIHEIQRLELLGDQAMFKKWGRLAKTI